MRGVIKKVRYLRQIFLIHIKFLCCYPSDKPRRLLLSVACAEAPLGLKAWKLSDPCFTCSEHPASSPSSSPVYCCIYFPSTLQWCAWRCAGVAFAEAGVRMCCCCCSLSAKRTGASMVPVLATMSELCFNTQCAASTCTVRSMPLIARPKSNPSQHGPHS